MKTSAKTSEEIYKTYILSNEIEKVTKFNIGKNGLVWELKEKIRRNSKNFLDIVVGSFFPFQLDLTRRRRGKKKSRHMTNLNEEFVYYLSLR